MAKKNFTDSLIGNNRSKKLDMLVSKPAPEPEEEQQSKAASKSKSAAGKAVAAQGTQKTQDAKPPAPRKRGRKKKDIEKDSFFYTVDKDFLFQVKAAAFWDRRDISEFITRALRHYMEQEMGESELRRAVREFKSRLEEESV